MKSRLITRVTLFVFALLGLPGCTQLQNLTDIGTGLLGFGRMTGDGVRSIIGWFTMMSVAFALFVGVGGCSQESRHNMARDVVYVASALDDLGYEGEINGTIDPSSSTTLGAGGLSHVSKTVVNFNVKKTGQTKAKDKLLCPWLADPYANTLDNVPITEPSGPIVMPATQPATKEPD
jgi:hypothetical protein